MTNGNFTKTKVMSGDGEEQPQTEELLVLLAKVTKTNKIVLTML